MCSRISNFNNTFNSYKFFSIGNKFINPNFIISITKQTRKSSNPSPSTNQKYYEIRLYNGSDNPDIHLVDDNNGYSRLDFWIENNSE